uniref:Uncharacterized protein n=1 Tax=Euplotes harpa TaxID=151035 RepID=A0A7S3J4I0_9SPIT|mmetsp:Transcript_16350/g.18885  ORF Transcript_16350/g.18885 Transcript_16350/m.18885 type:complete len:176 (+) Transcript_16350:161-688(+)
MNIPIRTRFQAPSEFRRDSIRKNQCPKTASTWSTSLQPSATNRGSSANSARSSRRRRCSSLSSKAKKTKFPALNKKFLYGVKKKAKKEANKDKPFTPNKPLFTKITLEKGISYICRLNNHLTNEEIVNHLNFQGFYKIHPNSFVIRTKVKNPPITAKDVHEKVIYDVVRRDNKSK